MPVLSYFGDLWGFELKDEEGNRKIFCHDCYDKLVKGIARLTEGGKIEKVISALGTEDPEDADAPDGSKDLYICDGCGVFSK